MSSEALRALYAAMMPPGLYSDPETAATMDGIDKAISTVEAYKWNLLNKLHKIFDTTRTPARVLEILSSGVGMGPSSLVTAHMTEDDFRRYLPRAMANLRSKGTDERGAAEDLTGKNAVLVCWAQEAIALGVLPFPWTMLYAPGLDPGDEYTADLYLEDSPVGSINRMALLRLIQEQRQVGESRIVVFDLLLDDFLSPVDVSGEKLLPWLWRWYKPNEQGVIALTDSVQVGSGTTSGQLITDEGVFGYDRHSYNAVFYLVAEATVGTPTVAWSIHDQSTTPALSTYSVEAQFAGAGSTVTLKRYTGGVPTTLATTTYTLDPGVEYRIDLSARTNGASVDLRLMIDGNTVFVVNDAAASRKEYGRLAIYSNAGTTQVITLVSISSLTEDDLYLVDKTGIYQYVSMVKTKIG